MNNRFKHLNYDETLVLASYYFNQGSKEPALTLRDHFDALQELKRHFDANYERWKQEYLKWQNQQKNDEFHHEPTNKLAN